MKHSFFGAVVVTLLALVAIPGCGNGNSLGETGQANGSVTFNGQPLPEGLINFYNSTTGMGASATITGGEFRITDPIVAGEYQVSVLPPAEEPAPANAPPRPVRKFDNIPTRYRAGTSSKLVAKIAEGANTLKFEMVP